MLAESSIAPSSESPSRVWARHETIAASPPWANAWAVIVGVLALRLIYLIWLTPFQLIGDESYYWEQARHLDLCYNEKGPLLAWMIAACCRIFGDTTWAVRLPMVISSAVAAWAIGRLTLSITHSRRAAFLAVVLFCVTPAFWANAQICTQDGPLIVLWLALTAIGLRLMQRWHEDRNLWGDWLMLWAVLGVGVLLKQSVLVFLPSLAMYALIERRNLKWNFGALALQQVAGAALLGVFITPMIVWNARHGWPMLAHTLGHLGAGGDQTGHVDKGNALIWSASFLGGVIGAMGPAVFVLMIWCSKRATVERGADEQRWRARLWLMCAAWPTMAFFTLLSFRKPVIPSWPLPSLVPLIVLIADFAADELSHYARLLRSWRLTPQTKKPETLFHQLWLIALIYGIAGWLIFSLPTPLLHVPLLSKAIRPAVERITGHRESADELAMTLKTLSGIDDGRGPIVVTRHYMAAGLYSFYLPHHPTIYTAGVYLGKRSTTFDQWKDTDLADPALRGRTLLLVGRGDVPWEQALHFGSITPIEDGRYFIATNFQGPRADHPVFGVAGGGAASGTD